MSIKKSNKLPLFGQLNSDCQSFVTNICHQYDVAFTPGQLKFIEIAFDKHQFSGECFSRHDFPHLDRNNFSQIVIRINKKIKLITKEIEGYPPLYSLKGVYLDQTVREKHTGVNDSFMNHRMEQLYMLATKQPPQMHDIKLSSKTSQLYQNLLLQPDISPHPKNKQFIIPILCNPRFDSKSQISPNGRMDLHIGCSQNPLFCSIEGFSELIEYIGEVKHFLSNRANSTFISEPAHAWIFEYYHFNRDSEPLVDKSCRFSIGNHTNYFYIKQFHNGEVKARFEEKRRRKTAVLQEQENILKQEIPQEPFKSIFQKASELPKDPLDKLVK